MIAAIGVVMLFLGVCISQRRDAYSEFKEWVFDWRPLGSFLRIGGAIALLVSVVLMLVKTAP